MDARTSMPDAADVPETNGLDSGEKLSAYGRARRQSEPRRKIIRGTIGILTLLAVWQVMSVAYDLQQILPPPLAVAHTIFSTLTLNYEHPWLYGPNIYEHLASSFVRRGLGFCDRGGVRDPARTACRPYPRGAGIRRSCDPRAVSDPRNRLDPARDPVVRARQHGSDLRRVHRGIFPALFRY